MKCSRCGHRSNSIKVMGEHCRKKHPGSMKKKKKAPKGKQGSDEIYRILRKEGLI